MKILLLITGVAAVIGFSGCTTQVSPEYGYYGSQPGYWDRGHYRNYEGGPRYHDRYYSGYSQDYRSGPDYRYGPDYRSHDYWR